MASLSGSPILGRSTAGQNNTLLFLTGVVNEHEGIDRHPPVDVVRCMFVAQEFSSVPAASTIVVPVVWSSGIMANYPNTRNWT
jgi:hypothetical protein